MTIAVKRPPRVIRTTPALTLLPPTTWPAPGQWTYEAEAQAVTTDAIIKKVFNAVPVP